MSYLLDTNVISEPRRKKPDPLVLKWLNNVDQETTYLSALTIGEIKKGADKISLSRKKVELHDWLEKLRRRFAGRILSITEETFLVWGKTMAVNERNGLTRPILDSLLEATALEHDLILVTRNVKNFKGSSVTILNPWDK